MSIKTLVNGVPAETISVHDRGFQYGDGLFETIAVVDGKPLCLDQHIGRLNRSCQRLVIPFADMDSLLSEVETLCQNQHRAALKIIITRGAGGRGYVIPSGMQPTRIVSLSPWPSYPANSRKNGVAVQLCQHRYGLNPALAGIKHLNRLEQILTRSEITDDQVAEGLVMDTSGRIIEGTMSNLFLRLDSGWLTPDVSQCGVAGIVRQLILENQTALDMQIKVENVFVEQLFKAREVFLCNSIIGIWPVKQINEKTWSDFTLSRQIATHLAEQSIIAPA